MHTPRACAALCDAVLRCAQASLAAANVAGLLSGYPVWNKTDVLGFVDRPIAATPQAAPSIVNAKELKLKMVGDAA